MTDYQDESVEIVEEKPVRVSLPIWLMVLLALMVIGVGYLVYAEQTQYAELTAGLEQVNEQLAVLGDRTTQVEDTTAELRGELQVTSEKVGLTQKDLKRTRSLAAQNRKKISSATAQLVSRLEETQTQVGTVSTEVAEVQGNVDENKETLEETMATLDRTMGDLGLQSGLIARNLEELEALKVRGFRNYYDFDLRKSKSYTRVGEISLRLNKSDQKRQKYTVTVLANDKRIEKKDKTLLEPVQFYQQGTRNLLEIVVFEVTKNRVKGYLSSPKDHSERTSN